MKQKSRKRPAIRTILVCCEGACECALFTHLKNLYFKRDAGYSITLKNRHGGSPDEIVRYAAESEGYDEKYVWIDTDRPEIRTARKQAKKAGIYVFENDECIEKELLAILGFAEFTTDYKATFNRRFPNAKLSDPRTHATLLPMEKTEEAKQNLASVLSKVIRLLENSGLDAPIHVP